MLCNCLHGYFKQRNSSYISTGLHNICVPSLNKSLRQSMMIDVLNCEMLLAANQVNLYFTYFMLFALDKAWLFLFQCGFHKRPWCEHSLLGTTRFSVSIKWKCIGHFCVSLVPSYIYFPITFYTMSPNSSNSGLRYLIYYFYDFRHMHIIIASLFFICHLQFLELFCCH